MTTQTETKPWDFSHVLDLVNSLSTRDSTSSSQQHDSAYDSHSYVASRDVSYGATIASNDFGIPSAKLGDFGKIWQFLGTPLESPAPVVPPLSAGAGVANLPSKLDYTSDGATYFKTGRSSGKEVKWQDEVNNEPATDALTDGSAPDTPSLTKTQRKKQRRREKKAQEDLEALKHATVSESEADNVGHRTPARKASAHFVKSTPAQVSTPPTTPIRKPVARTPATGDAHKSAFSDDEVQTATAKVAEKLAELRNSGGHGSPAEKASATSWPGQLTPTRRQQSHPAPATAQPVSRVHNIPKSNTTTKQWPITAANASALKLFPSTVQPPAKSTGAPTTPQQAQHNNNQNTNPASVKGKSKFIIEPKIVRSGEDRHWALLMKLIGDFWEDRKHLVSPMILTTHNNNPSGIHVFVDASNIFIGFNDQLKRSRNIPLFAHLPPAHLSFDGLALLMERRRPVAKRVLAGSTPHLPAFDKAEAVGYECSILDKVYKARELTERQIYFKDHDRYGNLKPNAAAKASAAGNGSAPVIGSPPKTSSNGIGSGNGSSSETSTPQYAPAKMIEQGVDEILHLKILESVVDSEVPSTIVLATGDAAQAEYSSGFMAMLERALKKGWNVELVSWSKNISGMYRRKEFTQTWGDKFKVVYLDDYAEELLEM